MRLHAIQTFAITLTAALCLYPSNSGYGQTVWTSSDVLLIAGQQWQQLGDCLEVKLSLTKYGTFDGTEYGLKPIRGLSSDFKSTWYFSGNNYYKATMILNVPEGKFYAHHQAMLNGDFETLAYGADGPKRLSLHHPGPGATMSELPLLQMFESGLRRDVERLLSKATVETSIVDEESVVIATAVEQGVTQKYFFSTDQVRLLRETLKLESGFGCECNFTYRSNATSWFDLAKCKCVVFSPAGIIDASSFEIHEIIKHDSLSDDKFRVARPANVRTVDFREDTETE